jgi:hypothetical protein
LLREERWAFIQYGEPKIAAMELFDMKKDPRQYTNLVNNPEYAHVVEEMKKKMAAKMAELRTNDLGITY